MYRFFKFSQLRNICQRKIEWRDDNTISKKLKSPRQIQFSLALSNNMIVFDKTGYDFIDLHKVHCHVENSFSVH